MAKYFDYEYLQSTIGISCDDLNSNVKVLTHACAAVGKVCGFSIDDRTKFKFKPNPGLLRVVFVSWKMDVHWQGKYQKTTLDKVKHAAYFLYWMSKVKPVQLLSPMVTTRYGQLNEICAFWVACNIIRIDPEKVDNKHFENILYLLCYCDATAEALFPVMDSLLRLYP